MFFFCRKGIRSPFVLWKFIWNYISSSFYISTSHFQVCYGVSYHIEIQCHHNLDTSVHFLISRTRRIMSLVISPVSHHLEISRELLAVVIRRILQVPQTLERMDGIGKTWILTVLPLNLVIFNQEILKSATTRLT